MEGGLDEGPGKKITWLFLDFDTRAKADAVATAFRNVAALREREAEQGRQAYQLQHEIDAIRTARAQQR